MEGSFALACIGKRVQYWRDAHAASNIKKVLFKNIYLVVQRRRHVFQSKLRQLNWSQLWRVSAEMNLLTELKTSLADQVGSKWKSVIYFS